jgi:ArsR family transcriptional regulator
VTSAAQRDPADVARRLRILSHPERLRILDVLRREPECVCHLEAALGRPQPYISQQLGVLRTAGIIADEKDGFNVYYRVIDQEVVEWLAALLGPTESDGERTSRECVEGCCCPKCGCEINHGK